MSAPIIASGVAYVTEGRRVDAFDAFDAISGRTVWRVNLHHIVTTGAPAFSEGWLYVGANHDLYAMDAATGAVRWTFRAGRNTLNDPPLVDGGVVFADNHGDFSALDKTTGALLWSLSDARDAVASDGVVYVQHGHEREARDNVTGALLWSRVDDYRTAAVTGGDVYLSDNKSLATLDTTTGALHWSMTLNPPGGTPAGPLGPAVSNGIVYVSRFGVDTNQQPFSYLYAIDAATGSQLERFAEPSGTPTVVNGVAYLTLLSSGGLALVDAGTGASLRTFGVSEGGNYRPPALANGLMYVSRTVVTSGNATGFELQAWGIA